MAYYDNLIRQNERERMTPPDEKIDYTEQIIDFRGNVIPFEDSRYFYLDQYFKAEDALDFLTEALGAEEVPF